MCSSLAGSYKSIMLCARPTINDLPAISETKQCNNSRPNKESFTCGTVKKPWGSNVVIAEKSRVLKRVSSKDSVICKHKAWLQEMQEKRKRAESERAEEQRVKEGRRKEFKAKQATKGAILHEKDEEFSRKDGGGFDDEDYTDASANTATSKPAWALTEDAAHVAAEEKEAEEEDDLLCFVENLDFDHYLHDMELNCLMKQVQERIRALQKEKNIDETKLQAVMDSEMAAQRAESLNSAANAKDNLHNIGGDDEDGGRGDSDDEIMSIAETVRSEGTLGSIHSQRSVHALVARSRERIGNSDGGGTTSNSTSSRALRPIAEAMQAATEATMAPPVLITHIEDDGARIAGTKSLNKLPFMNRNPAV